MAGEDTVGADTFRGEMPRFLFRPRWIAFHLVVILAVVLMVNLGFWQLDRLDERRADNESIEARTAMPVAEIGELLDDIDADPDAVENRLVRVSGSYLPDQIVLFNRSQGGRAADNVLTPLVVDDTGRTILVNRGAIPVQATPPVPPEVGVQVLGRLRPTEERSRGGLTDADVEVITQVRRVDIAELAPQLPGDVIPMYLELIAAQPEVTATDPEVLVQPTLGEGNHLSYAVQWFIFAVCVVIGWVLAVRRSIRVNVGAPHAAAPEDHLEPDRVESPTTIG